MRRAAVLAASAAAVTQAAAGGRPRRRRAQATDDDGGFACVACAAEESLTAWYVAVSNTEYTCDPATYPIYVNKDGVPTTAHVFKHPACSYEYGTRAGATGGAVSWVMQWCADDGTIWEASDCACEAAGGGACAAPGWDDDDGYDDDGAPCDYDPGSCVDDRTTTDAFGDDCAWYACNRGECGAYDDGDFAARDQCCACGGGTLAPSASDDDTKTPSAADDGGDGCALHVAGPVVTSPSNQVATVDSLENYELAFTMELASDWTPSLGTGHWQSILRIGNLDYQRLPGIWFHETQNALYVMQSYSGCVGSPWSNNICEWGVTTTGVTFTAGVTYEIRVVVESNQMTVYVDGVSVGTASGPAVDTVTDAAVYVGDPWHNAATKVTLSDIRLSDLALSEFCRGNVAATTTAPVVWYQDGANKDYNGMKASCGEQLCTYDQLCPGGEPYTAPVGGQQAVHDMWAPIIPGPGEGTQNWVQVGTRASGSVISTHSRFKFYSYPHRTAACAGSTPTMLVRPTLTTAGGARPTSFYIRAALRAASRPRA